MRTNLFTPQSGYKKQARLAAVLWTLLIFILCLWPGDELPKSNIRLIDKWVHFLLFAPFCFLWLCAYPSLKPRNLALALVAGGGTGYLVEILQRSFPSLGRSYDIMDIAADAVGSLLGVILFAALASFSIKKQR